MRKVLSIGEDVTVIGRYGGIDSFDFPFVQTALIEESFPGMLFLFVNTIRFCVPARLRACYQTSTGLQCWSQWVRRPRLRMGQVKVPRCPAHIEFLQSIQGDELKARYIRTCDAMLHAKKYGETFGSAVAEFASYGRPVFTKHLEVGERGARYHLQALGKQAILYYDRQSLVAALRGFNRSAPSIRTTGYDAHSPENVTRTFYDVFLRGT